MIEITNLKFACGILAVACFAPALRAEGDLLEGAASRIVWGENWAGPEMKDVKSLEGKVVLLKIWGGCEGCRELTPGMVAFARKHKDDPLHVIASYCEPIERDPVVSFLKSQGWDEGMANLSVMYQTHYTPEIEIPGMPYYLLFDHTGKLRYHHLAGAHQGGNGDKYQEQVVELLAEAGKNKAAMPLTDLRSWANTQGQWIEASLLGVRDGRAKFQMSNGRTYEYPLEKLSEETRREIAELVQK